MYKFRKSSLLLINAAIWLSLCGCSQVSEVQNPVANTENVSENTSPATEAESEPALPDPEPEPEEILPVTVTILGKEYDQSETALDLSDMAPEDISEVSGLITGMPELKEVNLMPAEGEPLLSLEAVATLKETVPDVHFVYEFDMFEQHLTTEDTEVSFIKADIGNEGEETVRQALKVLDKCEYFLLDDCGIDDEIMDGIRTDFPDTKVVWRIHVGWKSALTDDQVIRMTHGINDSMTGPLKYCHEVIYMDLGHDSGITDISFIENMPDLECLILSDAQFTDLTPVTNCSKLTWLELVSCYHMQNLSVIADMDSIKYLNISFTRTNDISGIMDMELDRFSCIGNPVSREAFDEYAEAHPDCLCVYSGNPYGYAWRYDDYGYHYFSYYARMREVFRYDRGCPGGFKMPEDPEEAEDAESAGTAETGTEDADSAGDAEESQP
ncbi:MAG: hypothetical protein IKI46_01185 [Lachnospiraceae bacterium]|nr:hypothetical protein [Lachnospiraceae bacterium]